VGGITPESPGGLIPESVGGFAGILTLTATDLLREVNEADMPPPFRHMTPLTSEEIGRATVRAVARGRQRVVLPHMANILLLGEALSPRIGNLIASALTVKPIAWGLGISRGSTYHQAIGATAQHTGAR
jgi:hypothetical protein